MIRETRKIKSQLAIIGTGLAGLAAGIFATEQGIKTTQVGHTGSVTYTTGYLDLFGSLSGQQYSDPWQGVDELKKEYPNHPLCQIDREEINVAMSLFVEKLTEMGVGYLKPGSKNLDALLPSGVCKPTISMPLTMAAGIRAKKTNASTLIIDFIGLQGFSGVEFVANLKPSWPELSNKRLQFPGMESGQQLFPEVMARSLEVPENRRKLAELIKPLINGFEYLGLPAILGIHLPDEVHREMEGLLGIKVFEIPTMPPSVAGIRLREIFEQRFPAQLITLIPQHKVEKLELTDGGARLFFKDPFGDVEIESQAVILATGRFLSGGLAAGQQSIRESLLNIPVSQPKGRDDWYSEKYFAPEGHGINRAGVEVDDNFRPLDEDGRPLSNRLFAIGTVLANQDWVRQRCGAAISISTAYQAVKRVAGLILDSTIDSPGKSGKISSPAR
ncbi:MAG: glycerol-3-phosphate dehydrogenase subunit GlpB [Magnetococcales bacterium]|nr:glycerol-3-phosphate dehydrogenase subunit GlpB [Magnetococcales bacterium]